MVVGRLGRDGSLNLNVSRVVETSSFVADW
jgi:hypothetical protein